MLSYLSGGADLSLVTFDGIVFPPIRLPDLRNTVFIGCDFSKARIVDSDLSQSTFVACRFRGLCLERATLFAARFQNCDVSGTRFSGCDLAAARFGDCDLAGARFDACDVEGTDIPGGHA